MTHQQKLEALYKHMASLGVPSGSVAPPLWRLLWRFGFEVPPPLFLSFISLALIMGTFFGLLWGLIMWVLFWSRQGMPVGMAVAASLLAGVLFGCIMAAYMRRKVRKYALPSWADYTGAP